MKRKIYEIDGTELMEKKLEEFKKELISRAPEEMHELFEMKLVGDLVELAYKVGFQDGAVDIGEMIQSIIKGEIKGPEYNSN